MRPTNEKLEERAARIVSELAAIPVAVAHELLAAADHDIKVALVSGRLSVSAEEARVLLTSVDRFLDRVPGFDDA